MFINFLHSKAVRDFLRLSYELDIEPSMWRYVSTMKFRQLMAAFDVMTE